MTLNSRNTTLIGCIYFSRNQTGLTFSITLQYCIPTPVMPQSWKYAFSTNDFPSLKTILITADEYFEWLNSFDTSKDFATIFINSPSNSIAFDFKERGKPMSGCYRLTYRLRGDETSGLLRNFSCFFPSLADIPPPRPRPCFGHVLKYARQRDIVIAVLI